MAPEQAMAGSKHSWLDFVGVGPQRAGTSWLHENFRRHSQVILPREPVKETYFFDRERERGESWYRQHFPAVQPPELRRLGEFGPSYFDVAEAPGRIYEFAPECRIIVSLRNPIERSFSLFLHHFKRGRVTASFDEAVRKMPRILDSSDYRHHVPRWLETFGQRQVHFVLLDDIGAQPKDALNRLCGFLDIVPFEPDQIQVGATNKAFVPQNRLIHRAKNAVSKELARRHLHSLLRWGRRLYRLLPDAVEGRLPKDQIPQMTEDVYERLLERFDADIVYLEGLLDRSLDHWRTIDLKRS